MTQLFEKFSRANLTEVDLCKIKEEANSIRYFGRHPLTVFKERVVYFIATKTILSTLMPDKDFTEMINLLKFLFFKTTVEENQSALVSYRHSV